MKKLPFQRSKKAASYQRSAFSLWASFRFPVRLVLPAIWAKLFHFQTLGRGLLVFRFAVVPVLALAALELNNFSRHKFL
jgi:hypothetical protein